jgi:hypothetical protein
MARAPIQHKGRPHVIHAPRSIVVALPAVVILSGTATALVGAGRVANRHSLPTRWFTLSLAEARRPAVGLAGSSCLDQGVAWIAEELTALESSTDTTAAHRFGAG